MLRFHLPSDGGALPDRDAAWDEAIKSARHLRAERLGREEVLNEQRFKIVDELGVVRAIVPMKDAIGGTEVRACECSWVGRGGARRPPAGCTLSSPTAQQARFTLR